MPVFFIILTHELQISFRHIGKILANFLFFVISVSVFFLLAQNQQNQDSLAFYSVSIIWFSLLFCIIFSATDFLKKDFDDGTIEQILLTCENFEIFTFAKMLANWLVSCLPILVLSPLILLGMNFEKNFVMNFFILLVLASIAINFICSFCGSLSILGNSAPVIAMIALPLIIPILLIAYSGVEENFLTSFKILSGFCVFIGTVAVFFATKIIKIASE